MKSFDSDLLDISPKKVVEAQRANDTGQSLPREMLPTEFYFKQPGKIPKTLPPLFYAGPFPVITEPLYDILRQFDIGAGHLYPAKLSAHDRKTPIPGSYHILNIGQTKEAFLDAHSPNARKPGYPGLTYKKLPVLPQDNDIALRATALAGTDIWMDPMIGSAFFLSGRLVAALQAAKLAGKLKLTRCRVLLDN